MTYTVGEVADICDANDEQHPDWPWFCMRGAYHPGDHIAFKGGVTHYSHPTILGIWPREQLLLIEDDGRT